MPACQPGTRLMPHWSGRPLGQQATCLHAAGHAPGWAPTSSGKCQARKRQAGKRRAGHAQGPDNRRIRTTAGSGQPQDPDNRQSGTRRQAVGMS
jgi:hypothetical protein